MATYNYTFGAGGTYASIAACLAKVYTDGNTGSDYTFDQVGDVSSEPGMSTVAPVFSNNVDITCSYNVGKKYSDRYKIDFTGGTPYMVHTSGIYPAGGGSIKLNNLCVDTATNKTMLYFSAGLGGSAVFSFVEISNCIFTINSGNPTHLFYVLGGYLYDSSLYIVNSIFNHCVNIKMAFDTFLSIDDPGYFRRYLAYNTFINCVASGAVGLVGKVTNASYYNKETARYYIYGNAFFNTGNVFFLDVHSTLPESDYNASNCDESGSTCWNDGANNIDEIGTQASNLDSTTITDEDFCCPTDGGNLAAISASVITLYSDGWTPPDLNYDLYGDLRTTQIGAIAFDIELPGYTSFRNIEILKSAIQPDLETENVSVVYTPFMQGFKFGLAQKMTEVRLCNDNGGNQSAVSGALAYKIEGDIHCYGYSDSVGSPVTPIVDGLLKACGFSSSVGSTITYSPCFEGDYTALTVYHYGGSKESGNCLIKQAKNMMFEGLIIGRVGAPLRLSVKGLGVISAMPASGDYPSVSMLNDDIPTMILSASTINGISYKVTQFKLDFGYKVSLLKDGGSDTYCYNRAQLIPGTSRLSCRVLMEDAASKNPFTPLIGETNSTLNIVCAGDCVITIASSSIQILKVRELDNNGIKYFDLDCQITDNAYTIDFDGQ